MIPGSAPHIWENNLESDKRRDTALLLELLCLCAKKKEPLAALFYEHKPVSMILFLARDYKVCFNNSRYIISLAKN